VYIALKLRESIDIYIAQMCQIKEQSSIAADRLSIDDWEEIRGIHHVLAPLKQYSRAIEGVAVHGYGGALWEWMYYMNAALDRMEEFKQDLVINQGLEHMKTTINLIWKKLDKYFSLSDDTPAYRAAILLNPFLKIAFFEKTWSSKPSWVSSARQSIKELYHVYRNRFKSSASATRDPAAPPANTQQVERGFLDRYDLSDPIEPNDEESQELPEVDEFEQYMSYPRLSRRSLGLENYNPINFWLTRLRTWPVLGRLALDLLATPAMSSSAEREFSLMNITLTDERNRMAPATIEALQLLKSAIKNDTIFLRQAVEKLCKASEGDGASSSRRLSSDDNEDSEDSLGNGN